MPLKLIKRGDIYYIRGTVAGQRVYESTRIGDKKSADILRARREAEIIERGAHGRVTTATFAEAALTYLESGGEGRYLPPILTHFGPRFRLTDMSNDAVNQAARALYPTAAPSTINRQLITPISAVVNMAADDGLCAPRRFRRRKEDNAKLRWLTPEEADRLVRAADPRTAVIITFLLGTGCRVGEALALIRDDLYLSTGEAFIRDAKNGESRMVRFPVRTKRLLAASGLPEAGRIFRTPKGLPYKLHTETGSGGQMQTAFNNARAEAGLGEDVTPHTCRHTWATWYYAQTRDFGGLMDHGGWKKADMANRYRKLAPIDLPARLRTAGWNFSDTAEAAAEVVPIQPAAQRA